MSPVCGCVQEACSDARVVCDTFQLTPKSDSAATAIAGIYRDAQAGLVRTVCWGRDVCS